MRSLQNGAKGTLQLLWANRHAEPRFNVLVVEGLDCPSRDQKHIAGLHKRMTYLGGQIVTKAEGETSEMHIGLCGTMSALFLRQLAEKTHWTCTGFVPVRCSC
jgi:hypothetical protein